MEERAVTGVHLAARHVGVDRAGRRVLEDVTAAFPRGRTTTLVGPSGAGKTTLLRTLNRLEEPTTGSVLLDGEDICGLDPCGLRRRVGMVFQTPVLFPGDVRTNLVYGLDACPDDRLAGALSAAGLPAGFLDRDGGALSVGEAQRVTIARALVRDPEVLLLDEPTSALDPDATAGIERLVGRLVDRRGLTVVFVTHDLDQAARVGQHALLLIDGRVVGAGDPEEVQATWRRSSA